MTLLPLDREPGQMIAGDSMSFAKSHPELAPGDGWTLTYRLFGPIGTTAAPTIDTTVDGAVDGGGWILTFEPAITDDVVADGTFRLVGRAENATTGEARTIFNGQLRILANPLEATPTNVQTHEERTVALIEAAIEGRVPSGMEAYAIDGRSVTKIPMRDLLALRATYRHLVWKQRNPGRAAVSRVVRFGAP